MATERQEAPTGVGQEPQQQAPQQQQQAQEVAQPIADGGGQEVAERQEASPLPDDWTQDPRLKEYMSKRDKTEGNLRKEREALQQQIKELQDRQTSPLGFSLDEQQTYDFYAFQLDQLDTTIANAETEQEAQTLRQQQWQLGTQMAKMDIDRLSRQYGLDPSDKRWTEALNSGALQNPSDITALAHEMRADNMQKEIKALKKELSQTRETALSEANDLVEQREAEIYTEAGLVGNAPTTSQASSTSELEAARREYQALANNTSRGAFAKRLSLLRQYPQLGE